MGKVGVIGLGYVGLPLALAFAEVGEEVYGIDVDQAKIDDLCQGRSHVEDVSSQQLGAQRARFQPTSDPNCLSEVEAAIICVPTPLRKTRDPDISYIISASEVVARHLHPGMLVVLESTTYPGTTEEVVRPMLEARGLRAGEDFFLAFSPERIDPGNRRYGVRNTPKVVGGVTPKCTERAAALYRNIVEQVVEVSSATCAEWVKLLENTFRVVNIGLVNELALLSRRMGVDIWEVVQAAATKPFGFTPFYPGPGTGGHCIPIDPLYLAWKAKLFNFTTRFIELADEVNRRMPEQVVNLVAEALNNEGKAIRGSRILLLGVAYKKDVSDTRESPALEVLDMLHARGAEISYHDPHVDRFRLNGSEWSSIDLDGPILSRADCVVILTDHSSYDWKRITSEARVLVDTRNATSGMTAHGRVLKL